MVREVSDGPARLPAMYALIAEEVDPVHFGEIGKPVLALIRTSRDNAELKLAMTLAGRGADLARLCAPAALPYLQHPSLAYWVLHLLETAGPDPDYIPALRDLIYDGKEYLEGTFEGLDEYRHAASLLCRCGRAGVEVVVQRIGSIDEDSSGHRFALRSGLERHIDIAYPAVLQATRSKNARLRRRIARSLVATKDKGRLAQGADALVRLMLLDEDAAVRKEAARRIPYAVRSLDDVPRRAELREAARAHPDAESRFGAIEALARVELVPLATLEPFLDSPSPYHRTRAIAFVGRHGKAAARYAPAILERIEAGDDEPVCMATLAAIAPEDPAVLKVVLAQLDSKHDFVVASAIDCTALMGPSARAAEPKLRKLMTGRLEMYCRLALWKVTRNPDELEELLYLLRTALRAVRDAPAHAHRTRAPRARSARYGCPQPRAHHGSSAQAAAPRRYAARAPTGSSQRPRALVRPSTGPGAPADSSPGSS